MQWSPTECGVSERDLETSTMRKPWLTRGYHAMTKKRVDWMIVIEYVHVERTQFDLFKSYPEIRMCLLTNPTKLGKEWESETVIWVTPLCSLVTGY